jgi:hypothetical protein
LSAFCQAAGIDPNSGWTDPVSDDHQPHFSSTELNAKFEQQALAAYEQSSIPASFQSAAAGFAGIRIMQMGAQSLNPEIGKAVLINAIQAGAKTVPTASV